MPRTALLIDDNPTFLSIISRFLNGRQDIDEIATAPSGSEALRKAREMHPDLVLLDLGMPGLSGLEILPVLRTILPHALIIVLTLLDTDAYRRAAEKAGADAFVSKAALHADLMTAIDRLQSVTVTDAVDGDARDLEALRYAK